MNTMNNRLGRTRRACRAAKGTALALVALGAVCPTGGTAQQRVVFDGQGGISIPAGRLGTITDPGPNVGVQIGYLVSPRVALNVDGNVDLLNGARLSGGAKAPDLRQWRYSLGVAADFLPADRWALIGNLGAGIGRFSSDEFTAAGSAGQQKFAQSYFSTHAGLKLGYALSRNVTTYLGARTVLTAASETDTRMLADLDPEVFEPFGSAWSVPVSVGLNVKLGGGRPARVASAPAERPAPMTRVDDGQRREEEARRLCDQAEAALAARDYARARSLLERAKADYPGTTCANSADARLDEVAMHETIAERVHFEFNRSQITDAGAAVLQLKADVLKRHPDLRIVIEGHCDERGSLEYNQALGMRRAQSALQYLMTLGVPETMLRTVTFGEERPLVPRSDEQSWRQNRRAEFVVQSPNAS